MALLKNNTPRRGICVPLLLAVGLACSTPADSNPPGRQGEISVRNTAEFLQHIGSDRTLILQPGDYVMPQTAPPGHPHLRASKVFDGYELVLTGLKNLRIRAVGRAASTTVSDHSGPLRPRLLARPRYANVLTFENSGGIWIEGIVAGHSPEPGSCVGGVLRFRGTNDVMLKNVDLFGSGTEGLTLENVNRLTLRGSRIRECTYGIMTITDSRDITLTNSRFVGNRQYDLINVTASSRVLFDRVRITGNRTGLESYSDYALFHLRDSDVTLRDSDLKDNTTVYFQKHRGSALKRSGTTLDGNRFARGIDLKLK